MIVPYSRSTRYCFRFFFYDTATTALYTLSLHDALPICQGEERQRPGRGEELSGSDPRAVEGRERGRGGEGAHDNRRDRKSTRLNSSHSQISYAVFCLKKKIESRKAYLCPAASKT